jgi:hypothetical protein
LHRLGSDIGIGLRKHGPHHVQDRFVQNKHDPHRKPPADNLRNSSVGSYIGLATCTR